MSSLSRWRSSSTTPGEPHTSAPTPSLEPPWCAPRLLIPLSRKQNTPKVGGVAPFERCHSTCPLGRLLLRRLRQHGLQRGADLLTRRGLAQISVALSVLPQLTDRAVETKGHLGEGRFPAATLSSFRAYLARLSTDYGFLGLRLGTPYKPSRARAHSRCVLQRPLPQTHSAQRDAKWKNPTL